MANVVSRLARGIARIPKRLLAAAGWPYLEPTGFGVGTTHTGDIEEIEAEQRHERETWRRAEDEHPPAKSD
jgi:hypothetical protein